VHVSTPPSAPICLLAATLAYLVSPLDAQTPHPRLLFTAGERAALQAKVAAVGTPAEQSFASMATSVSFAGSSNQLTFGVYSSLRRMQEVAFRYQMTGDPALGENAKSVLLQAANSLTPTGTASYLSSTYPCALAFTFDMVYPLLTASEKNQVVGHLEQWVSAMRNGHSGVFAYSSFAAANNNYSFAWCTGIAIALMAIEGDSNYPNLQALVHENLQKLRDGWLDAISPDGSVDEWYGYANYGPLYSMNAAVAGINCGYGDYIQGTNALRTPRWMMSSLINDHFFWGGDSSPNHKGTRMDPVLYYPLTRTDSVDPEALWGLNRVFALDPPSNYTPSHAWSPYVIHALYYPAGLTPSVPEVSSGFFRDNMNLGTGVANRFNTYPGVGEGGHAMLHNSPLATSTQLSAFYLIRDEWMDHNHEDDGHFNLASEGASHYVDIGFAVPGTYHAGQTIDHNIVVVDGVPEFMGPTSNYYNPPSDGRFGGRVSGTLVSPFFDYLRGEHRNMWMMNEAERSVVMVKDPVFPYVLLVDHVDRDGATNTYDEIFHSGGPVAGAGTLANPMQVTAGARTLRAAWLSPPSVSVLPGPSATNNGITYWRHRVRAVGSDVTFLSIHGKTLPSAQVPLVSPSPSTNGAELIFSGFEDKVLVQSGAAPLGDLTTQADARFAWLRTEGNQLVAWAVGEGQSLVHGGLSLLIANRSVSVVSREGQVWVTTEGAGLSGLNLVAFTPFNVTAVRVDGQPAAFTQTGNQITIGGTTVIQESVDDRAYTFVAGWTWDGVPSTNAFITPSEELTSLNGWADFSIKDSQPVGGRPLALGMNVSLLPGASATGDAGFQLETSPRAADVLSVLVLPDTATTYQVSIHRQLSSLGTAVIPLAASGPLGRFTLQFDPLAGSIEVQDSAGIVVGSFTTTPVSGTFFVRAVTTPFASIDNITLFDSLEDGSTSQGVCFFSTPQGLTGIVIRSPNLLQSQDSRPLYNGSFVEPWVAYLWYVQAGIGEFLLSGTLPASLPSVAGIREAGWSFAHPAVPTTPGNSVGIWLRNAAGFDLYGSCGF
jgi:hypothetical protein